MHGIDAIPATWIEQLELRAAITAIADDLFGVTQGALDLHSDVTWDRYPGY